MKTLTRSLSILLIAFTLNVFAQSQSKVSSPHAVSENSGGLSMFGAGYTPANSFGAGYVLANSPITPIALTAESTFTNLRLSDTVGNIIVARGIPYETRKDDGHGVTLSQVKLASLSGGAIPVAPHDYIARAFRIGLASAVTDNAQMAQAIHDAELKIYTFAKVDDYLYRKGISTSATHPHSLFEHWVWTPLRQRDEEALQKTERLNEHADAIGYVSTAQYTRAVPERVLADIENLIDCAPLDTIFFVSDYRAVNPDPFLAVATPKMLAAGMMYIVDVWDEPGFTENPSSSGGVISASAK